MKTAAQIEIENQLPAGSISISYDEVGQISVTGITLAGHKYAKLQELAAARWAEETGGITLNGMSIATGRADQAMINSAWAFAQANPGVLIRFKTRSGFVDLDADQIAAIGTAVGTHVQACFAREAELAEMVSAAETVEEVEVVEWSFPAVEE